jgi:hypothetical protein
MKQIASDLPFLHLFAMANTGNHTLSRGLQAMRSEVSVLSSQAHKRNKTNKTEMNLS